MARDIGTVELIMFGSRDIGMAGVTVTVSGFTAIIECGRKIAAFHHGPG
jgi:hypothetical protein